MDDIRKKISKLVVKLRSQEHLSLWALANEKVIYSVAVGEKVLWGPKTQILVYLMNIACKIKAANLIIFLVGFSRAIFIWRTVKGKSFKAHTSAKFKKIFAGFGASSEEYLYIDYAKRQQEPPLQINWVTHEGLQKLGCPSLILIFSILARNSFGHANKLKSAIHEISSNEVDFLTVCALNVGLYSFYRSYFRMAKSRGIEEITVLAPDMPAFASVDEGIKTFYLQHGLMSISVLFPKINRIDAITIDEANYLQATLPDVQIVRINKEIKDHHIKNNILMILSPNVLQGNHLIASVKLSEWALTMGLRVVIRPTQRATTDELIAIQKKFLHSLLDDITIPLHCSLEKWNPKFVVSDWSTGLATALDYGCLSISLYDNIINDFKWNNMIYPMRNRVLFWPRDISLIESVIHSEKDYFSQLMLLRNHQDKCFDS